MRARNRTAAAYEQRIADYVKAGNEAGVVFSCGKDGIGAQYLPRLANELRYVEARERIADLEAKVAERLAELGAQLKAAEKEGK